MITTDEGFASSAALMMTAAQGAYYGYPECCIWEFCINLTLGRLPASGLIGWGASPISGYVPCSACRSHLYS